MKERLKVNFTLTGNLSSWHTPEGISSRLKLNKILIDEMIEDYNKECIENDLAIELLIKTEIKL